MDKVLYNNEVKQRYLQTLENDLSRKTIDFLFGRLSETEELLGKDIYDFKYQDFIMMFDRHKISSKATFMTNKSIIRGYIKWCTLNGYCEDTLSELNRVELGDINAALKIQTEMFKNEDDLFDCISEILADEDENFRDIYLAFYGLYWYDLSRNEIYNLPSDAVSKNTINVGNESIVISDRFSKILSRYRSASEVIMNINGQSRVYKFVSTTLFIKNINISNASYEIDDNYHSQRRKKWDRIMNETSVNSEYYGKRLVPTAIQKSGNFYRAYLDEKKGVEITSKNICSYFREFNIKKPTVMAGLYKSRDYEAWKNIFAE